MALLFKLALDREQIVLSVIQQHDAARFHAGDLTAQLRADRAACARDEYGVPGQIFAHARQLHLHRLAPEHVLHAHGAHLPRQRAARLQQLEHRGQRAHRDAPLPALAHDARAR